MVPDKKWLYAWTLKVLRFQPSGTCGKRDKDLFVVHSDPDRLAKALRNALALWDNFSEFTRCGNVAAADLPHLPQIASDAELLPV
jgi:hypothetical protein